MPKSADLSRKLGSSPSWKDALLPGEGRARKPKDESARRKLTRKTYLLYPEDVSRLAALAEAERVGVNELARYLLNLGCEWIESGKHRLPTEKREVRRIVP